ncbi:MAG TPA: cytochrome P450 [Cyanobacteria bacterium UBA11149]|nr:cytochrome P450 [Cyanobacteria bacterium UBA11367]HBE60367.1 cytochrome P450 [Cyanobacteria bacterium UBA11366]HBK62019.1 cytochrome P450 [Cyanobacteria bacterium UBA11166]HBR74592.1 cytochrome P450 [Cyanobacteria bacterium UBA11159]HBS71594.1 cytochrome P450 [Cyanobacteria bacterium UBA11153]HBW92138.1 cytochrome P450 [Cyanobacteria bacterium UBA11149]HCA95381.1 cytochrome P450 [Cyanobacteria bacterium UBA9226]
MSSPNNLRISPFFQKIQWIFNPVGYMEKAAHQYPDLFTASIGGFADSFIFVQNPQALQQILTNDRKQFSAPGNLNQILQPLVGNYSIFMLEGDSHKRERKLLMPSFHGDRIQTYGQLIDKITEQTINRLPSDRPFKALNLTQKITIQVIMEVIFGLYEGERCEQIIEKSRALLNFMNSPLTASLLFFRSLQKDLGMWSPWGYFLNLQKQLDNLLYTEICDRRQNPDPKRTDILSLLMSVKDEAGAGMTDRELRDELITFLFAGHDTTALAIAWGLYWIHRYPEVRQKLLNELDSLGDSPDPMTIFRLPYLTAVCNETLRIHSVAMLTFPRIAEQSIELLGHKLDKGTIVTGCMYLIHQREDLYPEPKKFKPERFLERQFSPFEFIPFGGGVRRCMGEALAQLEMKLALATILSRYQLELAENKPVKPQRRGVVLAPKGGVKMILKGKRVREEQKEPALSLY